MVLNPHSLNCRRCGCADGAPLPFKHAINTENGHLFIGNEGIRGSRFHPRLNPADPQSAERFKERVIRA